MQSSLLVRLRRNGSLFLVGALLLLIGIPAFQILVLAPTGFGGEQAGYFTWIQTHPTLFLSYRALLLAAFVLLWTLPFSLYRIIIAQEIMAQQEQAEQDAEEDEADSDDATQDDQEDEEDEEVDPTAINGLPPFAWRGKGFVVLAVWAGIIGLGFYLLSTLAGTLYLLLMGDAAATSPLVALFNLGANGVGFGLIGLGILFSGAMICRTGTNLWPTNWVFLGYVALAVGALNCLSAIAVACVPGPGQSALTTAATLLFGVWVGWLGFLLARLKPEA